MVSRSAGTAASAIVRSADADFIFILFVIGVRRCSPRKGSHADSKRMSVPFPAPWFGGKSKVAAEVWARFGNPETYWEPFAGSLAVLLGRPDDHVWWRKIETVNDLDGHVVNFHRSAALHPDDVARHASYPVTELDLTARHLALTEAAPGLADQLRVDPDFCDPRLAGWWLWGLSCWVGGYWCSGKGNFQGAPDGATVFAKPPMVHGAHAGKGIHRQPSRVAEASTVTSTMNGDIAAAIAAVSNRLRRVRVTCGEWDRNAASAIRAPRGKYSAVFLDPPYALSGEGRTRHDHLYAVNDSNADGTDPHIAAREWALEHGDSSVRIAYCAYRNAEEDALFADAGWSRWGWTASGGYALQSKGQRSDGAANRHREVIYFSPACEPGSGATPDADGLF